MGKGATRSWSIFFLNSRTLKGYHLRITFFLIFFWCTLNVFLIESHQWWLSSAFSTSTSLSSSGANDHSLLHHRAHTLRNRSTATREVELEGSESKRFRSSIEMEEKNGREDPIVTVIQDPEEVGKTRSITFLSSGYGEGDYNAFQQAVTTCMETLNSGSSTEPSMINADPWPRYMPSVNVYSVFQVSEEVGVSSTSDINYSQEGSQNNLKCVIRDFSSITGEYLACSTYYIRQLASYAPAQDVLVVLLNDDVRTLGSAGEGIAVVTVNATYLPVLLVHFLSRALANLADEFSQGVPGNTLETIPNCAKDLMEATLRWESFFPSTMSSSYTDDDLANDTLQNITRDTVSTGPHVYPQGCTFSNFYAPSTSCIMQSTAANELCPVCREAVSLAFASPSPSKAVGSENEANAAISLSVGQCPPPHYVIVAENETVVLFAGDFALRNGGALVETASPNHDEGQGDVYQKNFPSEDTSTVEVQWVVGGLGKDLTDASVVHSGAYFHVPPSFIVSSTESTFITAHIVDRSPFVRLSQQGEAARSSIVFELVKEAPLGVSLSIPSCYSKSEGDPSKVSLGIAPPARVFCPSGESCKDIAPTRSSRSAYPSQLSISLQRLHHDQHVSTPSLETPFLLKRDHVLTSRIPSTPLSSLTNTTSEKMRSSFVNLVTLDGRKMRSSSRAAFYVPFVVSGACSLIFLLCITIFYLLHVSRAPREVLSITFLDRVLVIFLSSIIVVLWIFAILITSQSNFKNGSDRISVLLPVATSLLWLSAVTTVFCALNFLACLMRWYLCCAACAVGEVLIGIASVIFGGYAMLASLGGESKEFQNLFYSYWVDGAQKQDEWVCPFQETHECSGYTISCFQINSTACVNGCVGNEAMIPCGMAFTSSFSSQFDLLYSLTLTMSCLLIVSASLNVIYYLRFRQISRSGNFHRTFRLDAQRTVLPITFIEARIARKSFNYAARGNNGKMSAEDALKFLDVAFCCPILDEEVKLISRKTEWTFDELMLTYFPFVQTSLTDPRMLAPEEAEAATCMLQLEKKQFKRLKEFEEASGCLSPETLQTLFQDHFGKVFMPENDTILSVIREAAKECSDQDVCRGLSPSELEGLRVLWVALHPAVSGSLDLHELGLWYSISHHPHQLETLEALEKWKSDVDVSGRGVIGWREFCYPYARRALLRKARRTLKIANCSLPPEMISKDTVLQRWGKTYTNIFLPYEKEIPLERLAVVMLQRWSVTLGSSQTFSARYSFLRHNLHGTGKFFLNTVKPFHAEERKRASKKQKEK